jgi:hypothetical protein
MAETDPSRVEAEELAATIASVDPDDLEGFFGRLGAQLKSRNVPCVRITYSSLNSVQDAVSTAGALPSLPNILLWIVKVWRCHMASLWRAGHNHVMSACCGNHVRH